MEFLSITSTLNSGDEVKCVQNKVDGHKFWVDSKYEMTNSKILGGTRYRLVCSAFDTKKKRKVAIKRVRPFAKDEWEETQALREVFLLKRLRPHPNVRR